MGWSKIEKEDFVLTKVLYRGRSSNETVKAMTTEFDPKAEEEKFHANPRHLSESCHWPRMTDIGGLRCQVLTYITQMKDLYGETAQEAKILKEFAKPEKPKH
eukprot:3206061-Rhodomonas_salina.3